MSRRVVDHKQQREIFPMRMIRTVINHLLKCSGSKAQTQLRVMSEEISGTCGRNDRIIRIITEYTGHS